MHLPYFFSSQPKSTPTQAITPPLEMEKPLPPSDSLQPEHGDMFSSFPPFPSPNPAAYTKSPLELAASSLSNTSKSNSTASSSASSASSSPDTSPSLTPIPSHPRRQYVQPGTRIRKCSMSESKSLSKKPSPKPTPESLTPRDSSTSISTLQEFPTRERRCSRGKAFEEALRIGSGAWCCEKQVRFNDADVLIEEHK